MSMQLVNYEIEHKTQLGVISPDGVWIYPLSAFDVEYHSMLDLIKGISDSELQFIEYRANKEPYSIRGSVKVEEVSLLAPIIKPEQDIICLGINYMDHAAESAKFKKEAFGGERPFAIYFSKRVNEAVSDGEPILAHEDLVTDLDYEAELAVILRKDAKNVSEEDVKDYIFGYTIINDVSARTIQTRHKQWYFGKSLDGFTPMGPCITTMDAIAYPPELDVRSYVNGELRQNGNTRDLIFNIDHIVSELSKGMTLKAGTIISTGTPAGVGMGFTPPKFLNIGDEVVCEIDGIGRITNQVKS